MIFLKTSLDHFRHLNLNNVMISHVIYAFIIPTSKSYFFAIGNRFFSLQGSKIVLSWNVIIIKVLNKKSSSTMVVSKTKSIYDIHRFPTSFPDDTVTHNINLGPFIRGIHFLIKIAFLNNGSF